jgi:hypothetical protein
MGKSSKIDSIRVRTLKPETQKIIYEQHLREDNKN